MDRAGVVEPEQGVVREDAFVPQNVRTEGAEGRAGWDGWDGVQSLEFGV